MWQEFREFAMRGSVIDLAVGIIIGGAFGRIVTSLVNDLIMPPIGLVLGIQPVRPALPVPRGGQSRRSGHH